MAPTPDITVVLSIEPDKHSFSEAAAPTLSLTVTSRAKRPLTLLAWGTIFHPSTALLQHAFKIMNVRTGTEVGPQHTIRVQRAPIKRLAGSPDEELFLTLPPGEPVTVSTAFGYRAESYGPPRQSGHEDRIKTGAHGRTFERPVCGVDGLESDGEYEICVVGSLNVGWWRWGTRDQVLERPGSTDWQLGESEEPLTLISETVQPVKITTSP